MSFNIVLQTNTSEDNKVTKSLTTLATLSCNIKDGTSIINPTFLVTTDIDTLKNCNYCTVSAFDRSYFVKDIRTIRNGLTELTCHVDVLSSNATQLKALNAIIQNNENKYNLYINDGQFKTYQNPNVLTKAFPSGFTNQEFVLAIAGA